MIAAFLNGWKTAFRFWRQALIVYFLQFLLALTAGMTVFSKLEVAIGNSLGLEKMLSAFDFTVYEDFINVHGGFMSFLQNQVIWLSLIWLIFSAFISGGLLFSIVKKQPTWSMFWAGGARYFFSFFKIGIFVQVFFLLLAGLIFVPVVSNFESIIKFLSSEKPFIYMLIGLLFILVFIGLFLFGWTTYAKLFFIKNESTVWKAIRKGFADMTSYFFNSMGVLKLLAILQLLVVGLYWFLEHGSGMVSTGLVIVFFIIQQLFVFFRILWRIAAYASLTFLSND